MEGLTTTSYAILCLLAVQPWTTYELAQQMARSLDWIWPRAQSVLYDEPKRLVARGLAKSERSYTGRRPRTVYSITPKGRRALRAWLDNPGAGPVLAFEALIQVAFADHGTKEQLLRTLHAIGAQAEERRAEVRARLAEYRDTGGPFPERLHIIALVAKLMDLNAEQLVDWAKWATAEVERWPTVKAGKGVAIPAGAFD